MQWPQWRITFFSSDLLPLLWASLKPFFSQHSKFQEQSVAAQGGFRWSWTEKRTCVFHILLLAYFESSLIARGKSELTVFCHLVEVFCSLERFSGSFNWMKWDAWKLCWVYVYLFLYVERKMIIVVSLGGFWEMEFSEGNEDLCSPQRG